jgi:hypothetical protein
MVLAPSFRPDMERYVGLAEDGNLAATSTESLQQIISIKLAAAGYTVPVTSEQQQSVLETASDLFRVFREQGRLLESHLCPIDQRVQDFLNSVFLNNTGDKDIPQLPRKTFSVDRHGLAKELCFPQNQNEYHSEEIHSYRLDKGGVLHNPLNDKRTTSGVFHIADYGLPVPADKVRVPLITYQRLLKQAFLPPKELNTLPYTSQWDKPVESMVSLQLRPLVCPEIPGVSAEKRMEVRCFVPGSCPANLDFVESVFGNAGDPSLPENDAALDTAHWTGTTGCVILAPHLRNCRKIDVGLPHKSQATPDQIEKGMCYEDETELYNSGKPFKITCRDERGIMVTILADNYFGTYH